MKRLLLAAIAAGCLMGVTEANARTIHCTYSGWGWERVCWYVPHRHRIAHRHHRIHVVHRKNVKEVMRHRPRGSEHVAKPRPSTTAGAVPLPKPPPIDETAILPVTAIFKPTTTAINIFHEFWTHLVHNGNAPTDKLPKPLQIKLAEIQASCSGFRVISTVAGPGAHSRFVAGTRRISLHALNLAADVVVNSYKCLFARIVHWRGGASVDPQIVRHVHLSYGGREDGIRFHHHGGSYSIRHARRHHGRVATLSPFIRLA